MNTPVATGSAFPALYTTRVAVTSQATGPAGPGLALELRMPEEIGDDNPGPSPEQFFAAGYAACFHSALSLLARQHLLDPEPIMVEAAVAFARDPADGGYRLSADLVVTWPGVERERAAPLLAQASALCPYAKMSRQDLPATITWRES